MTYEDARWVAKHLGRSEAALFSPAEVEALAPMLQDCSFNPGEVLFDRGSVPDGVWIIKNGWVELLAGATPAAGVIELLGPPMLRGDPVDAGRACTVHSKGGDGRFVPLHGSARLRSRHCRKPEVSPSLGRKACRSGGSRTGTHR